MPRVRRATPMSPSLARKVAVLLDEARPGETVRRSGWTTLKCVVMECDRRRSVVGDVVSSSSNASSAGTRGSIGAMVSGRRGRAVEQDSSILGNKPIEGTEGGEGMDVRAFSWSSRSTVLPRWNGTASTNWEKVASVARMGSYRGMLAEAGYYYFVDSC